MTNTQNIKTKLEKTTYPKMVTDLATQNQFLKILSYSLVAVALMLIVLLVFALKKAPEVIALDPNGTVASVSQELHATHVESAVKKYLEYRYSWNPQNIESQLKQAEYFIYSSLAGSFKRSMQETIKFVKDRSVIQRVYANKIEVNLKARTVTVSADRITEFDALKAATILKTTLSFDVDSPTTNNPWGIYFTKETESGDAK